LAAAAAVRNVYGWCAWLRARECDCGAQSAVEAESYAQAVQPEIVI